MAALAGAPVQAARCFGAAERTRERFGIVGPGNLGLPHQAAVEVDLRAALGETAFAQAWAVGRALTLDEADDEALAYARTVATALGER